MRSTKGQDLLAQLLSQGIVKRLGQPRFYEEIIQ